MKWAYSRGKNRINICRCNKMYENKFLQDCGKMKLEVLSQP
jgi:hypothetical protein